MIIKINNSRSHKREGYCYSIIYLNGKEKKEVLNMCSNCKYYIWLDKEIEIIIDGIMGHKLNGICEINHHLMRIADDCNKFEVK